MDFEYGETRSALGMESSASCVRAERAEGQSADQVPQVSLSLCCALPKDIFHHEVGSESTAFCRVLIISK